MDNNRKLLVYRSGESLKQFFPVYWSKIQKHYESSAPPRKVMPKLSPLDFHRKKELRCYEDREMRSAIMYIAPLVSYFVGVRRKVDCSGVIIDWDDANGQATVLTSSKLMRSPSERDDYYIVVRLENGKILLAEENYVDYYHNIATFKVNSDVKLNHVKLSSPPPESLQGVGVVALRRDFHTCKLSESSGLISTEYPYFGCELLVSSTCSSSQTGEGGPLITKTGQVCGINFFDGYQCVHPLPTSVISSCLDRWKNNGVVVRPWFGLSVIDIAELPHDAFETMPEFCGDSTAIVKEVYEGSPAYEAAVSPGDSVTALNEYPVFCAYQYAQALSSVSRKLGDYYTYRTPHIMLTVKGNPSRTVVADILRVDDMRFCCSWLGNDSDWSCMEPLVGSQTEPEFDIGVNTNVSLPLGFVTDTESESDGDTNTGMVDDSPDDEMRTYPDILY
ncbi:putative protease Do-like 14 isoform X1 [Apium graveolens]|uniref:putative protease Do-like 14 isoform X1 n=1 Tax=Apium graveolens TaxID=4045 RepID=UPI003D799B16